jgi:hypothetical protein
MPILVALQQSIRVGVVLIKTYYNTIIGTLTLILSLLVLYISINTSDTAKTFFPKDFIQVSPITGEVIKSDVLPKKITEVTYAITDRTIPSSGLSSADIIYEYSDKSDKIFCKALFYSNEPPVNSLNKKDNILLRTVPKFNFIDVIDMPRDFTRSATSIFVTLSYNISSNFLYENNQYIHFRNKDIDIDKITSKPITVSNVIVQFSENTDINSPFDIQGSGKGLLFYGGKVVDIKWLKEKDNPIKLVDEEGNPMSLLRGQTWWIIVKDPTSVVYN